MVSLSDIMDTRFFLPSWTHEKKKYYEMDAIFWKDF